MKNRKLEFHKLLVKFLQIMMIKGFIVLLCYY